jgi:phosphoglucosamine mutase
MRKLFGTDGIRAVAGEAPLDRPTIHAVGLALAHSLAGAEAQAGSSAPEVLLGMDTRESSPWMAAVIAAGLRRGGARVRSAGVITTPGVAFLARKYGMAAGVVISASHNPWQDNGIKVFGGDGYKLPDEVELSIEREIFRLLEKESAAADNALPESAPPEAEPAFRGEYERFLRQAVPGLTLAGQRIVVDCANGAASAIAPELFAALGGDVHLTHVSPNGRNINEGCGALHPEVVARETVAEGAEIGITFDGDADRALFADREGRVVNGDTVLLVAARDLQARGALRGDVVVATTMSNMGLEAALSRSGIRMLRAPVGDKYVLEMMQRHEASLGGEQSGHILFPDRSTTGDGLLTALMVLDVVQRTGKRIDELAADLKVFPQVIVNVRVREKRPLEDLPAVASTIQSAEQELDGSGRVVVRYSGTEALARVMIEAESETEMRRHAERIAAAIRAELGA